MGISLMGILLMDCAEAWCDALTQEVRNNFEELNHQFQQRFIDAEHTRMQRQMATLWRAHQIKKTRPIKRFNKMIKLIIHTYNYPKRNVAKSENCLHIKYKNRLETSRKCHCPQRRHYARQYSRDISICYSKLRFQLLVTER